MAHEEIFLFSVKPNDGTHRGANTRRMCHRIHIPYTTGMSVWKERDIQ